LVSSPAFGETTVDWGNLFNFIFNPLIGFIRRGSFCGS
jgi:hypothetical protein